MVFGVGPALSEVEGWSVFGVTMTADPTEFVTFSVEHGVAAGIALASAVGLAVAVRWSGSKRLDWAVRRFLAVACIAYESYEIVWRAIEPGSRWQDALPLHMCDLSLLVAPLVLLTQHRYAFEALYFWGIGGATQSLATPTLATGFPSRDCINFFLGHALIIASALYAAVVIGLRPTWRSIPRVWLATLAYALLILPINFLIGTNFLYVAHRPYSPTLLDWLGCWPWYLLALQPVVLFIMFLCYVPFLIGDLRAARR